MILFRIFSIVPFRKRFAMQFRCPRGLIGQYVARMMRIFNFEQTKHAVEMLDVQTTDDVLDIGFGTGEGIGLLLEKAHEGTVTGVEISQDMMKRVSRRYAKEVRNGRLALCFTDATSMPFDDSSFDKIIAVNVLYFWDDPIETLREIRRVLRPGGMLCLSIASSKDAMNNVVAEVEEVFTRYTGPEDVFPLLDTAGFTDLDSSKSKDVVGTKYAICAASPS